MPREKAVDLIRTFGTERVMFGSDYPVVSPKDEIERFLSLDLSEQEREDILYNNAKRFLNL